MGKGKENKNKTEINRKSTADFGKTFRENKKNTLNGKKLSHFSSFFQRDC